MRHHILVKWNEGMPKPDIAPSAHCFWKRWTSRVYMTFPCIPAPFPGPIDMT